MLNEDLLRAISTSSWLQDERLLTGIRPGAEFARSMTLIPCYRQCKILRYNV